MSRATKVPKRIAWAVELVDPGPADRILEVGCGPGVAVALVCPRLPVGRVTAIDRSAKAIERARARNAEQVAAGRAVFEQVDLAGFHCEPDQFDKAFAVNVNVFWTTAADRECAVLARVLRAGGVLRLFYDMPLEGSTGDLARGIAAKLTRHGFTTEVTGGPSGMSCIAGWLTADTR